MAFATAALAAAPYVLNALGGIFGKKKKYIDAAEMERRFGAQAITDRAQQLAQSILASPYGQQLLAGAAQTGSRFQNEMSRRAAASGLSPDTGASAGAGMFATSAAASAASNLENRARSDIYSEALPVAQNLVQQELAAEQAKIAGQNAEPSTFQKIAAAAGAAAQGLQAAGVGAPKPEAKPAAVVTPGATAPLQTGPEQFTVAGAGAPAPGMEASAPNTTMPPAQPDLMQRIRASRFDYVAPRAARAAGRGFSR